MSLLAEAKKYFFIVAGPAAVGKSSVTDALQDLFAGHTNLGINRSLAAFSNDRASAGFKHEIAPSYPNGGCDDPEFGKRYRASEYGGPYADAFHNLRWFNVLLDIPHTKEFAPIEESFRWFQNLSLLCEAHNAVLVPVFCTCEIERAYENMKRRGAERDTARIQNPEKFRQYAESRYYGRFPDLSFNYIRVNTTNLKPTEIAQSIYEQTANILPAEEVLGFINQKALKTIQQNFRLNSVRRASTWYDELFKPGAFMAPMAVNQNILQPPAILPLPGRVAANLGHN